MKRTAILSATVIALVLAACGTEQTVESPTPIATPAATPTPTASPTPSPESEPADEGSGTTGSLADELPDEVGGLQREADIAGMEQMFAAALSQQGLDADEADFAFAIYGQGELIVTGFRGAGLDTAQLEQLARIMSTGQVGGTDFETEAVTVGGKQVLRMSGADMPEAAFLYISDDAFFTIVAEEAALAEELLSQLP